MRRELLHIYGPFSIYSFGVALAVGLLVFIKAVQAHPRFKILKLEGKFTEILLCGIVAALTGGRILYAISEPEGFEYPLQLLTPWTGGLSLLGGVIAVLLVVPWYLKKLKVPILPFFDLIAIHIPLMQSIARIGCFLAGCCHGIATAHQFAVTYTDPESVAPLDVPIHPTQLYSSAILFGIFLLMYGYFQKHLRKPGQLTAMYLMLASTERFVMDFLRGDRTMATPSLSISQLIAVILFVTAFAVFTRSSLNKESSTQ